MNKNYCYIHIPFCESKCKYCRFASIGSLQKLQIQNYVNYLSKEISNNISSRGGESSYLTNDTSIFKEKKLILSSIYFGGGTPSVLNKKQFQQIFSSLKEKYIFGNNIEISIESTPQNITIKNLKDWLELGINRISIGIQSLNNKTLKEIGRKDNNEIFGALELIKNYFNNIFLKCFTKEKNNNITISIDFIIGLPYVEKGGAKKDIKTLLEKYSFINHISVYMLEDYYEEPKEKESKFQKITYPNDWGKLGINEDDYLLEYLDIKNFLNTQGFSNYEISNFSKRGKECKHNKAYWNHSNILAFGLGASGFLKPASNPFLGKDGEKSYIRYSNSDSFKDYYSGKNKFLEKLTKKDIFLEKVMFGLRTGGLEKNIYKELNGEKIKILIKEKLLFFNNNLLLLDNKGIILLDYIIGEIVS